MKERLEDIAGEPEAERLIRTEYLDEAGIYRIDERMEGIDRFEADYDKQRRALGASGRLTASAREQTRKLRSLNEEVTGIKLTILAINKLFTAIMEGTINAGSREFIEFVVAGVTGMAGLTDVQRQALDFYLSHEYRSRHVLQIPYEMAKEYDILPEIVKEKEEEAETLKFERASWCIARSWRQYQQACDEAWEQVKPKYVSENARDFEIDAALKAIRAREGSLIYKVEEFIYVCDLLSRPENRIKVRSGQYIEREVNARSEHDMIGERARELMALPKYTVYVKKLESTHSSGIYRTSTKALPDVRGDPGQDVETMIANTRNSVCRLRYDIQNEIYNREMPETEESEPPPLWG